VPQFEVTHGPQTAITSGGKKFMSDLVKAKDFAGGIVIHVSWIGTGLLITGILLIGWLVKRKGK
jgi:ammonia channel protein AmtB